MLDPVAAVVIALIGAVLTWLTFRPAAGLYWRWRQGRELSERVVREDALKHLHEREYEGRLANEGEAIELIDSWSGTIAAFEYRDDADWPQLADGAGHSLVPLASALPQQPTGSLNDGANWRASTEIGGSPGRDDL